MAIRKIIHHHNNNQNNSNMERRMEIGNVVNVAHQILLNGLIVLNVKLPEDPVQGLHKHNKEVKTWPKDNSNNP